MYNFTPNWYKCLFGVFLLISSLQTNAQYRGVVLDSDSKLPVVGCHISLSHTTITSLTDQNGCFQLPCSRTGLKITVQHLGFETATKIIECHSLQDTIYIHRSNKLLQEVSVTDLSQKKILNASILAWKNRPDGDTKGYSIDMSHSECSFFAPSESSVDQHLEQYQLTGQFKDESGNLKIDIEAFRMYVGSNNTAKRLPSASTPNNQIAVEALAVLDYTGSIYHKMLRGYEIVHFSDTVLLGEPCYMLLLYKQGTKEHIPWGDHDIKDPMTSTVRSIISQASLLPLFYEEQSRYEIEEKTFAESHYLQTKTYHFSKKPTGHSLDSASKSDLFFVLFDTATTRNFLLRQHTNLTILPANASSGKLRSINKFNGKNIGKKTQLISKQTEVNALREKMFRHVWDTTEEINANSNTVPWQLVYAYRKAKRLKLYQANTTTIRRRKVFKTYSIVNKHLPTILGFGFYMQDSSQSQRTLYNGTDFFEKDSHKKRLLRYKTHDFWMYKLRTKTHHLFTPYSNPDQFMAGIQERIWLASKTSFGDTTVSDRAVWKYKMVNKQSNLTVFLDKADTTFIGYEIGRKQPWRSVFLDTLYEVSPVVYANLTQDIFEEKLTVKTIRPTGYFKQMQKLNIHGKKRQGRNRVQKHKPNKTDLRTVPTLKSTNGKPIALNGKFTLLAYWFANCPYCLISMPKLDQLHRELSPKDFQVVGVNDTDPDPIAVNRVLTANGASYLNTATTGNFLDGYEPTAYPTYILLDKDGQVLQIQEGYNAKELERMVRKYVK